MCGVSDSRGFFFGLFSHADDTEVVPPWHRIWGSGILEGRAPSRPSEKDAKGKDQLS